MSPREEKFSFTVSFHFQSGGAFFDGFTMETVVSDRIGAKYRVLVRNPEDNHFYTMKGMDEPMTQDKIDNVLEKRYGGSIMANEFAFEVFDNEGNRIFETRFNTASKIPALANDQISFTTFCWAFPLDENLRENLIREQNASH